MNTGPLTGVRVLDLTAVIMGPLTTQILSGLWARWALWGAASLRRSCPGPVGGPLPAPRFGEHSADLLREAGYSEEELQSLEEEGAAVFLKES